MNSQTITTRPLCLLLLLLGALATMPQLQAQRSIDNRYLSDAEREKQLLLENRALFFRYLAQDQRRAFRDADQSAEQGRNLIALGERTQQVDESRLRPGETVQQFVNEGAKMIAEGQAMVDEADTVILEIIRPIREQLASRFVGRIVSSNLADAIDTHAPEVLAELKEKNFLRVLFDKAVVTVGDTTTPATMLHDAFRNRLFEADGSDYRVFEPIGLSVSGSPLPAFSYEGSNGVEVASALILVELTADASSNTAVLTTYGIDLDNWTTVTSRMSFVQFDDATRSKLGIAPIPVPEEPEDPRERRRRARRTYVVPPPYQGAESLMITDQFLLLEKLIQSPRAYPMEVAAPDFAKTFERQVMERLIKHTLVSSSGLPVSAESLVTRVYGNPAATNKLGYSNRTVGVMRLEAERLSRGQIRSMKLVLATVMQPDELDVGPMSFSSPPEEEEKEEN